MNTIVGLVVTMLFSPIIYSVCGIKVSAYQMTAATALFTLVSVCRSYIIRRLFNNKIDVKMYCGCNNEQKTGWTKIKCCNVCGKPDEEFWTKY